MMILPLKSQIAMALWTTCDSPFSVSCFFSDNRYCFDESPCLSGKGSLVEQNGLEAAYRVCFNASGICLLHSRVLFPTRFIRYSDPRGYLVTPLCLNHFTAVPSSVRYDGSELVIDYHGEKNSLSLSSFVSPSEPTAWFITRYERPHVSPEDVGKKVRTISLQHQNHRVWRSEEWVSTRQLEVSYSCVNEPNEISASLAFSERSKLCRIWLDAVQLHCPETVLSTTLQFAKIRTCESIYNAPELGLVHSPGGGMFYSGVWCNDQAEYAAPVLGMLGPADSLPCAAALNSLRAIAKCFDIERQHVPYSIEVDGAYIGWLDRGDAGMFAWGASLVVMTLAENAVTEEFLPHIKFACKVIISRMEGCTEGIVHSESDELEGRFPTGNANLSVNCIGILALESAGEAALCAGDDEFSRICKSAACDLRANVHKYFLVEDKRRYAYYAGCEVGRGWACLSALARLPFGKEALLFVLNDMWRGDGILTVENETDVWDRCTLYSIRAGYMCGSVELATSRLLELARNRLTRGRAVPYMQENNSSHAQLAAESALFIRVITEGLLGMHVKSGKRAELQPRCPEAWPGYDIWNVYFAGVCLSFNIKQCDEGLTISVCTAAGSSNAEIAPDELVLLVVGKECKPKVTVCKRPSWPCA